jgi:large subunit ribosomal protein L7e
LWEKNAKAYEAEYNASDKALVDNIRKAKSEGGFYVPAEAKLILVIRIRGYIMLIIIVLTHSTHRSDKL